MEDSSRRPCGWCCWFPRSEFELLLEVSYCAWSPFVLFQCPIPSGAVDTLLKMSRIRQEDEVWMCECVLYMHTCVCCASLVCVYMCVLCVKYLYMWCVCSVYIYNVCVCTMCSVCCACMLCACVLCACVFMHVYGAYVWDVCACTFVNTLSMYLCISLKDFFKSALFFFWGMSYVDKVGFKLTVYPWMDGYLSWFSILHLPVLG